MKTILFASAAAMALAGAASAQQGYVNLGYTYVDTEGFEFDTVNVRGGFDFHPNFALEGEALVGIGGDSGIDLNHSIGIFGKAQAPVGENFTLFARLGYAFAEYDFGTITDDFDGWAVGAGAEFGFGASGLNAIRAEYTYYDLDSGVESDALGISYVRRFGMPG